MSKSDAGKTDKVANNFRTPQWEDSKLWKKKAKNQRIFEEGEHLIEGSNVKVVEDEIKCLNCMDTGVMRCSNPDHGFIQSLSFTDMGRLGCPGCDGTGKMAVDEVCDECDKAKEKV